jgi:hypothetical protein
MSSPGPRATPALLLLGLAACSIELPIGEDHQPGAGGHGAGGRAAVADCNTEGAAFCDGFDTPHPGGRGGDLDESVWSFARFGYIPTQYFVRVLASTREGTPRPATFCGEIFANIAPGEDVRACPGIGVDGSSSLQLNELVDDAGGLAMNAMRIRRPFDFADRTGKIVCDVDAKAGGWWIEVWITEDPAPIPYHLASGMPMGYPRRGVGFSFSVGSACTPGTTVETALQNVYVVDDHALVHAYGHAESDQLVQTPERCFLTEDTRMNRLELRLSQDRAELWASDHDDLSTLALRSTVSPLDLPFSRGYVHFIHTQFQAGNIDGAPAQTYRWDNIGFDGPTLPTPRAYDVPDNDEISHGDVGVVVGYPLIDAQARTVHAPGIDLAGAIGATFNFNVIASPNQTVELRFNGGPLHTFVVPDVEPPERAVRGFSLDVPLDELVQGDNAITVRVPSATPAAQESIGNMDLTLR